MKDAASNVTQAVKDSNAADAAARVRQCVGLLQQCVRTCCTHLLACVLISITAWAEPDTHEMLHRTFGRRRTMRPKRPVRLAMLPVRRQTRCEQSSMLLQIKHAVMHTCISRVGQVSHQLVNSDLTHCAQAKGAASDTAEATKQKAGEVKVITSFGQQILCPLVVSRSFPALNPSTLHVSSSLSLPG